MYVANWDLYGDSTGLILHGDSGGPLFSADSSGALRVVGVTSGVSCFDSEFSGTLQALWARTMNPDNAALIRRIVFASDGRVRGGDIRSGDSGSTASQSERLPTSIRGSQKSTIVPTSQIPTSSTATTMASGKPVSTVREESARRPPRHRGDAEETGLTAGY